MKIAIDAMGGDLAPEAVVTGALQAARDWNDTEIILVGDEQRIRAHIHGQLPANVRIEHTDEVIEADDEPVRSVRRKKNASMVIAGRMVKERVVDAMISAGNTGALMAVGVLVIGRMANIERPALAPYIPTVNGKGLIALDLGANMDAEPEHLVQYAIMGSIYRSKVHGLEQPRVGLLNVGTEEIKGNELTKAAFPLLSKAPIHFVGNIEAKDVLLEKCDVLVCDGFAGNIMLKSLEGTVSSLFSALKTEFNRTLLNKIAAAILAPGLRKFKQQLDYREHGAAPLLGVNGICMKSHGSSNATAIKNAVRQTRQALQHQLVQSISEEITRNEDRS